MSVTSVTVPPTAYLPVSVRSAAERFDAARDAARNQLARLAEVDSESAIAAAAALDHEATSKAIASGKTPPTPANEYKRQTAVSAYKQGVLVAEKEAIDAEHAYITSLAAHREDVIAAAHAALEERAATLDAALAHYLDARHQFDLGLALVDWAYRTSDGTGEAAVPNYDTEPPAELDWQLVHLRKRDLEAALIADSQRHIRAQEQEAARLAEAARNAHNDAVNLVEFNPDKAPQANPKRTA